MHSVFEGVIITSGLSILRPNAASSFSFLGVVTVKTCKYPEVA